MLRKNAAAGRYDNGTRGELAKLLTDDLQAVHKDGHLHVMLAPQEPGGGAAATAAAAGRLAAADPGGEDDCAGHRLHSFHGLLRQ